MRSNYKRIGDFIELIDERNKKLEVNTLVGLSISKKFIPSVANTIGTDMANYKIIRKNQFACSLMQVRRDKKIPVALLQKFDEAIISQAYPVFQIKDESELLPQYLMMWMSRSEFDRHACFLAVGGVRGSLEWDDFCDMELPVPSIEKQGEIVKEFNTIVKRIKLNEQLNQKLEETAQTLYKHWFVDFEFPNADGKPYKSSGGKMEYNAELEKEVPKGWEVNSLSEFLSIKHGYAFKGEFITQNETGNILLSPGNFEIGGGFKANNFKYYSGSIPSEYIFKDGDMMVTMTDLSKACDTLGYPALIPNYKNKKLLHNQRLGKVMFNKDSADKLYFYWLMREFSYRQEVVGSATGTTVKHTSPSKILEYRFPLPSDANSISKFCKKTTKLNQMQELLVKEILLNIDFKDLLLSKITKVETEKEAI